MSANRVAVVEKNLDDWLAGASGPGVRLGPDEPLHANGALTAREALELFECQLASRALDVASRELKRVGQSFYTIGSAGHENDVVLGALLRLDDPCFLHYRSGALMMARARKRPGSTPVFDTLLGFCASAEDPASGGRHKVWGSRDLWVPPQTSTIASHLPKAAGLAFALARARRIGVATGLPSDAIVCCSFGDASANHATALAGVNLARYVAKGRQPVPILFVCEDNGIGISVPTLRDWIAESFSVQPYLRYFRAAGEIDEVYDVAKRAIDTCRVTRAPVFLHLACVRLFGHAGSDFEATYRTLEEIEAIESGDPLLRNARRLIATGAATADELRALVHDTRARVMAAAKEAATRPRLTTREAVMAPLAPYDEAAVREAAAGAADARERARVFEGKLPEKTESATRRTLAAHVNAALADELARFPELMVFGEDVGKKGGVYGVTVDLQRRFGVARVFDTLLDETSILGIAQGAAHAGILPIPEIQYLAYVHNALDQLRGEACSLSFFSNGRFADPMVVRIPGLAYQKGFGGHFHNDDSVGALRDIPGLMLACPARGDDAARMLRGAVAIARACRRVVVFLEPIALYHERDLYEDGDGLWLSDYPAPGDDAGSVLLPGQVGVYHRERSRCLIVSYANGLRLALRAARRLLDEGVQARVLDVRWLNPLPMEAIELHARQCGRVFVADECRATGGGIADAVIAGLVERGFRGELGSVRAADSYVPLGAAAACVLVSEDDIVAGVRRLVS
jgi:2-oxoisovalerate dehydrogenase E1 component